MCGPRCAFCRSEQRAQVARAYDELAELGDAAGGQRTSARSFACARVRALATRRQPRLTRALERGLRCLLGVSAPPRLSGQAGGRGE
eukprot:4151942-Pleurochrysis_carterae.AAC.1